LEKTLFAKKVILWDLYVLCETAAVLTS